MRLSDTPTRFLLVCGILALVAGLLTCVPAAPTRADEAAPAGPATPAAPAQKTPDATPATNVILLIGDGMGPEQVKLGRIAKGKPLCFEAFGHKTTCTTDPAEGGVTDSAAAGTALATGHKTTVGAVSLDPDGRKLETILERFKARGARTGLVTTTAVVDATPAVFAAHARSRRDYDGIAEEMLLGTRPDVVLGGGWHWVEAVVAKSKRHPGDDADPYRVVRTRADLAKVDPKKTARLLGIFAGANLAFELDRTPACTEPTLQEMTRAALGVLSGGAADKGFFLMVEGGRIDHACHGNDADNAAAETVAFDKAVQAVIDWVTEHKAWDRTLVIVTADHECGGLTVKSDHKGKDGWPDDVDWSTGGHTDTPVPVYARGLLAERAGDVKDNTDAFTLMNRCLETSPAAKPAPEPAPAAVP